MAESGPAVRALFEQALELASEAERSQYLDKACAEQPEVRASVEALLRANTEAGSFLGSPAVSCLPTQELPTFNEQPGTVIGPYKLLQQIGEGGMGVVFMAEQSSPIHRTVAIKIIKPGMDTKQIMARFEAERQALAMMEHPNIAKVLDAGATTAGRPYFVMELVKGVPITQYCDELRLPIRARLELFTPVCHAVQHAHQKGVIHRDIKPTNVLVAEYDGKPAPKIIDFGVAKATARRLTEKTMFTEFGQLIGTIEYMSPEQARFNQLDVDTRSDVYSLGVLLYELLTGTTPFDRQRLVAGAIDETLRIIREEEPLKPSTRLSSRDTLASVASNRSAELRTLSKLIIGELDWIVMKCLEKSRDRRYESANDLAVEIGRFLSAEPVEAVPPSAAYRFRKFASRNRTLISSIALVAAALVLGTGVSIWQAVLARNSEAWAQALLNSEQKARTQATAEAIKAKNINAVLQQMLGLANPSAGKGTNYTVRQMLEDFADELGNRLQDQPEVEAAIHTTIGNAFRGLQSFDKAEPHLKSALELRLRMLGPKHADVANSLLDYSENLFGSGDVDGAEEKAREALTIHQHLQLPDATSIRIFSTLQFYLVTKTHFEEAEEFAKRALEIAHRHPDSLPQEPIVLRNLAQAAADQGQAVKAANLARESVAMHQARHGDNHPETAHGKFVLAKALHDLQRFEESEANFREVLTFHRNHYKDYQTPVLAAAAGLAETLRAKGDQAALERLRAEIDLSASSPHEWESWYFRGTFCAALGDWVQASAAFEKAAERESSPDQMRYLYYLCLVKLAGNDPHGYRDTCDRIIRRAKELDTQHAANIATWACVIAPNAVAEPGTLILPIHRDYKGHDPIVLSTLGAALYRNNQFDEATRRLSEVIQVTPVDSNHFRVVTYSRFLLSMANYRLGRLKIASDHFDQAVRSVDHPASRVERQQSESWHIALALRLLRNEAEQMLSKALVE